MASGPQYFHDLEEERATNEKASLGVAYQKAFAALRPLEVYERIKEIHDYVRQIEESVVGRTSVKALESLEIKFRELYSGVKVR